MASPLTCIVPVSRIHISRWMAECAPLFHSTLASEGCGPMVGNFFGVSAAASAETRPLKQALLDEYKRFSDGRIKQIDRGRIFIVDDREFGGYGSNRELFGWFCTIFTEVIDPETVKVTLSRSIPEGRSIDNWVERYQADRSQGISFVVTSTDLAKLLELADAFLEITRPGVRYPIAAYKYVCPRVASALNRLHKVLVSHWTKS